MSDTLIDSYADQNTTWALATGYNITAVQSFQMPASAYTLTSAKFYLKNITGVTGDIVFVLYAHTGTYGSGGTATGSVLATSGSINASSLTSSFVLRELTFTGANTDFELIADIADLTDYKDEHTVVSCRVYQEAV